MKLFRKKTDLEYVKQIIQIAKKGLKSEDKESKLKVLKTIIKFTDDEINNIKILFDSDEFVEICKKIKEECKTTIKLIESKPFLSIESLLKKIINAENFLEKKILLKLHELDHYKIDKKLGGGGVGDVYSIKNEPSLVLKKMAWYKIEDKGNETYEYNLKKINEEIIKCRAIPKEVNISRTLKVGYHNKYLSLLIERVDGIDVHKRHSEDYDFFSKVIKIIANAPQSHYNKLFSDYYILRSLGFCFEIKPGNFMYNEKKGFFFIDIDSYFKIPSVETLKYDCDEPSFERALVNLDFINFKEKLSNEDKKNMYGIFLKLKKAGSKLDYAKSRWEEYGIPEIK